MANLNKLINVLEVELTALVSLVSAEDTAVEDVANAINEFKANFDKTKTEILRYNKPEYKEFNDAKMHLSSIEESFDSLQRKEQISSYKPDLIYGIWVALLVFLGVFSANLKIAGLGYITLTMAVLTLIAVLLIAGIRSNVTYNWEKFSERLYNTLPSRFFALFIVPSFLIAIWLGFGGVYAGSFCMETWDALYHSGLTISTLGYALGDFPCLSPDQVLALKKVMLAELWSGILGIVTVLALLVNRVSTF